MKILKPFIGFDEYRLLSCVEKIEKLLERDNEEYSKEIWSNDDLTNPVSWTMFPFTFSNVLN